MTNPGPTPPSTTATTSRQPAASGWLALALGTLGAVFGWAINGLASAPEGWLLNMGVEQPQEWAAWVGFFVVIVATVLTAGAWAKSTASVIDQAFDRLAASVYFGFPIIGFAVGAASSTLVAAA